jgi:undecaprenyl-diphosphatase
MLLIRSSRFIFLAGFFILVTFLVNIGAFNTINQTVLNALDKVRFNQTSMYVLIAIAVFGEVVNIIIVSIILTVVRSTRKMGMIIMITIVILSILLTYLKPIAGQKRPPTLENMPGLPKGFNLENDSVISFAQDFSYPSVHFASMTAFTYLVGLVLSKRHFKASKVIWIYPLTVGTSQMMLHQYYVIDLLGGFLIGMIISIVTSNVMKLNIPYGSERDKKS